jgi:hypothetical protein
MTIMRSVDVSMLSPLRPSKRRVSEPRRTTSGRPQFEFRRPIASVASAMATMNLTDAHPRNEPLELSGRPKLT